MSRARDLADSADKDIAGTLTLDGLSVSGDVGVGTSSPSSALHVSSSDSGSLLRVTSTGGDSRIQFETSTSDDMISVGAEGEQLVLRTDDAEIVFKTNENTERLRIDSSGNLLVGMTSSSVATDGSSFNVGGSYAHHTSNGGVALYLNRRTSDGDILSFRKDNTTVGSIGTGSVVASDFAIKSNTSRLILEDGGGEALLFDGARIHPNTNNAVDLGYTTQAFKNLYLSGGVYLGGTGSANKLDDYEEGTWTPNISGSGGQALTETTAVGYYTKIGNTVHAWFTVVCSDNVGDSNYQLLYGLPFTPNTQLGYGLTGVAYFKTGSTGAGVTASIKVNSSYSYIFGHRDSAGTVTTASAYDTIDGHITYTIA